MIVGGGFYGAVMNSQNGLARSSSAEYLTFVAATGGADATVELHYEDENIWLTQKLMAELYGVTLSTINGHVTKLKSDGELDMASVIRNFRCFRL